MIENEEVVTKWLLDSKQFQGELDALSKSMRKEEAAEKRVAYVREQLTKQTEAAAAAQRNMADTSSALRRAASDVTGAVGSLKDSLLSKITVANLATQGIGMMVSAVGTAYEEMGKYTKAVNTFRGDIGALRDATKGYASDLDLMTSFNKLSTLGIKLNADETKTLYNGVRKLSAAMGIEMKDGLESAAVALGRQSKMVADNLGLVMDVEAANKKYAASLGKTVDVLTDEEKKLAFQAEFLDQMKRKSAELAEGTDTLTGSISKLWVGVKNVLSDFGYWANRALTMNNLLHEMLEIIDPLGQKTRDLAKFTRELQAADDKIAMTMGGEYEPVQGDDTSAKGGGKAGGLSMYAPHTTTQLIKLGEVDASTAYGKYAKGFKAGVKKQKKTSDGWPQFMLDEIKERDKALDELAALGSQRDTDMLNEELIYGAGDAVHDLGDEFRYVAESVRVASNSMNDWNSSAASAMKDVSDMGVSALSELASGMWEVADAFIMGEEGAEWATAKLLKSVLMSTATEAWAKGIVSIADAIFPPNPALAAKGAMLLAAGAAIGGAALGVSAGIKAGGGYDTPSSSGSGSSSAGSSLSDRSKSFGTTSKADDRPIYVNLYLDASDPAAAVFATRRLRAKLATA